MPPPEKLGEATPIPRPPGFGGGPAGPADEHKAPPVVAPAPTAKPEGQAVKPAKGSGTVTLAILPEAVVLRGRTSLGKTPLFSIPLPAGTHLLTVVGEDKVKRGLSVQVQAGKNTIFKMKLDDIPPQR